MTFGTIGVNKIPTSATSLLSQGSTPDGGGPAGVIKDLEQMKLGGLENEGGSNGGIGSELSSLFGGGANGEEGGLKSKGHHHHHHKAEQGGEQGGFKGLLDKAAHDTDMIPGLSSVLQGGADDGVKGAIEDGGKVALGSLEGAGKAALKGKDSPVGLLGGAVKGAYQNGQDTPDIVNKGLKFLPI